MDISNIPKLAQCLFLKEEDGERITFVVRYYLSSGGRISGICMEMVFSGGKIYPRWPLGGLH